MNQDYFEKKTDGSYDFTDFGIYMAYYFTMQKLVTHYLQNGYKLPPEKVQPVIKRLYPFIQSNVSDIDDYLNKLTEIAEFIGEKNPQRFIGFVSKNFMSVLEKTKDQVRDKELPKIKNRLENPYYAPGNTLIETYGDAFMKSEPLRYPLEAPAQKIEAEDQNTSQDQEEVVSIPKHTPENMPGALFLKASISLFANATPLDKKNLTAKPASSSETQNESSDEGKTVAAQPVQKEMPGEIILSMLKAQFSASKALNLNDSSDNAASATPSAAVTGVPKQFTLKEYASMSNKVNQFMKKKDNAGYTAWYNSLALKYKIFLTLNNTHSRELKGQKVEWNTEFYNYNQKTGWEIDVLQKSKEEVVNYRKVLIQIHQILREASSKFNDAALMNRIYAPIIAVFENDDDTKQKQTELKMLLLQITNPQEKEFLENSFGKLLDEIKVLYHIE